MIDGAVIAKIQRAADARASKREYARSRRLSDPDSARERNRAWSKANPEHQQWRTMIARCHCPKAMRFADYGGRGITVCDRWRFSYRNFIADMGRRPPGLTIDRVDGARGYEPGSCRWATAKQQARNRSNGRLVTAFGETKLAIEWTEDQRCRVRDVTLRGRLFAGWQPERAISTPPMSRRSSAAAALAGRWGIKE